MSAFRIPRVLLGAFLAIFVAVPSWAAAAAPILSSPTYAPAGRRATVPYVHPRMHRHRRRRSQGRKASRAFASGIPVASFRFRIPDVAGVPFPGDAHPPDHPPA